MSLRLYNKALQATNTETNTETNNRQSCHIQ
jgi:hypothetical protein